MNAHYTPPAERDASQRAWRTLAQGLFLDVATGVAVAATVAISSGIEWTESYWVALGLAVAKSAVTAVVSYFARKIVPPSTPEGIR